MVRIIIVIIQITMAIIAKKERIQVIWDGVKREAINKENHWEKKWIF